MLDQIKRENSALKLSKFITEVEERARLKEILSEKKKRVKNRSLTITAPVPVNFKTIRRRNAIISPQIR